MPIKQTELAAHWGCGKAYVNKLVKKGCPLDSLEAADVWRRPRKVATRRGKRKQPPGMGTPGTPSPDAGIAPPAPPPPSLAGETPPAVRRQAVERLGTLHQALLASIEVQTGAYGLVMESIQGPPDEQEWLGNRIAAYNKATEGRLKTEAEVQDLEVKAGRLLPYEEHTALLSRALMPLFSRLFSLGKRCAVKANPTNPVLAEKELAAAIKDACRDAQNEAFPVKWEDVEAMQKEQ